ncbi:MAG: aminotransferase class V-fold PLP-dependent enzyme [Patescibacteria group bacterium]|nr:aminotransferase class V-fold PLP-dependent enzyme [Patescibacteria group bacterium]MDE2438291.1 aminotransferase class V-fold PLP-dependent enzyme [Patescibacteria group bacterium]
MHRKDFPIFNAHKDLIYLDNAATAQKPKAVIDAMSSFYAKQNANIHRGFYALSEEASALYENARALHAKFVGAKAHEIVFTKNATEALNLVAYAWGRVNIKPGDEIVVSVLEHHSNFLPWQVLAHEKKIKLRVWKPDREGVLHVSDLEKLLTARTRMVCCTAVSNVLGTVVPLQKIRPTIGKRRIAFVVDAAQAVAHIPLDVTEIGCDFLAYSVHKMYGPTGVGVLYINERRFFEMKPFLVGGSTARNVSATSVQYFDIPRCLEAGTPPIAEVVASCAAIQYLQRVGFSAIRAHEDALVKAVYERLRIYNFVHPLSSPKDNVGVVSFSLEAMHVHDAASIFSGAHVAVRAGHHCAIPLHTFFHVPGSVRLSLGLYNDAHDIDVFFRVLDSMKRYFK